MSNIGAEKPSLDRHAKAEFLLESYASVRDEVIAGIAAPAPSGVTGFLRFAAEIFRLKYRPSRNFKLILL